MKAFVKFMMCAAVLMGSVVFSSCSKDDEGDDRQKVGDGIMATHTFYVTPDMLKFIDVEIEIVDFDGNKSVETLSGNKFKLVKEFATEKLSSNTVFNVKITRNNKEVSSEGEYDIALKYEFSAIRTFDSGVGKAITTGCPVKELNEQHVNIHKSYVETILNRIPKDVTVTHLFDDTSFGVMHTPFIEIGEE
jgi:hypothetical protein